MTLVRSVTVVSAVRVTSSPRIVSTTRSAVALNSIFPRVVGVLVVSLVAKSVSTTCAFVPSRIGDPFASTTNVGDVITLFPPVVTAFAVAWVPVVGGATVRVGVVVYPDPG